MISSICLYGLNKIEMKITKTYLNDLVYQVNGAAI